MLFGWLLARHESGVFCYRIEDTDRTRLVPDAIRSMLEDFDWCSLDVDEGPTATELHEAGYGWEGARGFHPAPVSSIQSLRLPRYREVAEQLIATGHAYRCDCSPERLEQERTEQQGRGEAPGYSGRCRARNVPADGPHVIRFRIPEGAAVTFHDAIRGDVVWNPVILRDTVILKTDGFPTYHLCSLVDDHDTATTHVLRGEEWLSSTPLHMLIYRALEWQPPTIAHLPVIVGKDGKKLSKRHGATFVKNFREDGYLPQALLNYLLLNGWSAGGGDEQEILTREEMIARFTLQNVHAAPATFSYEKLAWMNGVYMRSTPDEELTSLIMPFLLAAGLPADRGQVVRMIPHIRERMTVTLKDAVPLLEFLFIEPSTFGPVQATDLKVNAEDARRILQTAHAALLPLSSFEPGDVDGALHGLPDAAGVSKKAAFMTVRVAVTGRKATPPLFECISVLGKPRSLERLERGISALRIT
jgi:glutamyl-tRNA synthetase